MLYFSVVFANLDFINLDKRLQFKKAKSSQQVTYLSTSTKEGLWGVESLTHLEGSATQHQAVAACE